MRVDVDVNSAEMALIVAKRSNKTERNLKWKVMFEVETGGTGNYNDLPQYRPRRVRQMLGS